MAFSAVLSLFAMDHGGASDNPVVTQIVSPATTTTAFTVDLTNSNTSGFYSITNQTSGSGTATPQVFDATMSNYGLPFFDASSAATSANAQLEAVTMGGIYGRFATFDTADETPDGNWTIGVDGSGDAVFTGDSATGFTDTVTLTQGQAGANGTTPDIGKVQLGQQVYGLVVIPGAGSSQSLFGSGAQTIYAEGTGTSTITLDGSEGYWHVNGHNDTIALYGTDDEFYFSQAASNYTVGYDGNGNVDVTGGNTGTTSFALDGGSGEAVFSDGTAYGLNDTNDDDGESFGTGGATMAQSTKSQP